MRKPVVALVFLQVEVRTKLLRELTTPFRINVGDPMREEARSVMMLASVLDGSNCETITILLLEQR